LEKVNSKSALSEWDVGPLGDHGHGLSLAKTPTPRDGAKRTTRNPFAPFTQGWMQALIFFDTAANYGTGRSESPQGDSLSLPV